MSMDASAIQEIQKSQQVAEVQDAIDSIGLDSPVIAVPSLIEIKSLEKYQSGRNRFRGTMDTPSLSDFQKYCNKHGSKDANCFVNYRSMQAVTIFNIGTQENPGHADFSARLNLQESPEYLAALRVNGEKLTQRALTEFMEDYSIHISFYGEKGVWIDTHKAIAALRNIKINESKKSESTIGNFNENRSSMEKIEAETGDTDNRPEGFQFSCVPYPGLGEYNLDFRLSILTDHEKPLIVARVKQLEELKEKIGKELVDILSKSFTTTTSEIEVFIGAFKS